MWIIILFRSHTLYANFFADTELILILLCSSLLLLSAMPRLVNALFSRPLAVFTSLDAAAVSAQDRIFNNASLQESRATCESTHVDSAATVGSVKQFIRVRVDLHRLSCPGVCPEVTRLRTRHTGRLLSLTGTVTRVSAIKSHEVEQMMECTKCGYRFVVNRRTAGERQGELPSTCPSGDHFEQQCKSSSFRACSGSRPIVCDYQELRLQDMLETTQLLYGKSWDLPILARETPRTGFHDVERKQTSALSKPSTPRALIVILEDDLVDTCSPGDDVCITLTVQWRWYKAARDQRAELEMIGRAISVQLLNKQSTALRNVWEEDVAAFSAFWRFHYDAKTEQHSDGAHQLVHNVSRPLVGRDVIVQSICPQLCGLENVKLALLLTLLGGIPRTNPDSGTSIRGDSHLLLVGDPGMGKSQLLRFAAQVAPRAVMTTGAGSTAAGLTAAAVRADGAEGWTLEAGALVLADGGVCCIDEFDTISKGERAAIHEAMEQQTLSIAKGGIVATLRTRCSVLGATNPKSITVDHSDTLAQSTGLPPPLLSRFDCVLVVRDDRDQATDAVMASHMITSHCGFSNTPGLQATSLIKDLLRHDSSDVKKVKRLRVSDAHEGALLRVETISCDGEPPPGEERSPRERPPKSDGETWPFERLRRYIALARSAVDPILSPEAEGLIRAYYQLRRRRQEDFRGRPTIRLLESLVRMTQAHARLMWRHEATRRDVVVAIDLIDGNLMDSHPHEGDNERYYNLREKELLKHISSVLL